MARKRIFSRAASNGARWSVAASGVLVGAVLCLCVGSGSALAGSASAARGATARSAARAVASSSPQFYMESASSRLCASSFSGAPGTVVRQESCSEYDNHSGSYEEYWAVGDLSPGVHISPFHWYNGQQRMCLTIKNGALDLGTRLIVEPCGGNLALGQLFDKLVASDGGTFLRAYAESGHRVDDFRHLSDYCVGSDGGEGSALVLQRCDNRLARQSWFGLTDEGSPGFPGPGDPTQ